MAEQSEAQNAEQWGGDFDPFADPEERRVLFGALDSYRYVQWPIRHFWFLILTHDVLPSRFVVPHSDGP